jgi:hypothetical protein
MPAIARMENQTNANFFRTAAAVIGGVLLCVAVQADEMLNSHYEINSAVRSAGIGR